MVLDDLVPDLRRRVLVTDAFEPDEPRAGDPACERLAVRDGEEGILRSVEDERRRLDAAETGPDGLGALDDPVVRLARPDVARAVDDFRDERPHAVLVEAHGARIRDEARDDVVDDGLPVRPLWLRRRLESRELLRHRREIGLVGLACARARRHECQRRHAVLMPHGEVLCDPASHREPDDVRVRDRERVQ